MTDDQIKELVSTSLASALSGDFKKTIDDTVNGAITRLQKEHLPNIMKTAMEGVTKEFGTQFVTLTENLATLQTSLTEKSVNDGKKKESAVEVPPEIKATMQRLEKSNVDLAKRLEDGEKARQAAEDKSKSTEKESKVRAALGQFDYANGDAAEDAYILVNGKVEFDSDGKLVADGLPLEDFVKSFIPEKKSHLLKPVKAGGAGANSGNRNAGGPGAFQFESIKPGMSQEDMVKAAGSIRAALTT